MRAEIASAQRDRYVRAMGTDFILSVLMLAGLSLAGGGLYLMRRTGSRKQAWLMLAAASVMFANMAIWLMPLNP